MITSGEGKTRVWLKKQKMGDDILLVVGGGDKTHIGTAVMCVPGKKAQVLKYGTHKDHIVLEPIAKKTCEKYGKVVVAVGGIHIHDATKEEINAVIKNGEEITSKI